MANINKQVRFLTTFPFFAFAVSVDGPGRKAGRFGTLLYVVAMLFEKLIEHRKRWRRLT
jgi:hypothetical protein